MIRYITVKEVLRMHWRVIKTFGGSHGVRDLNLLESALARPKAGFGDYEAYPDIFMKAAVLLYSLIKNHPFIDGNKRTGLTACIVFLKRNGFMLQADESDIVTFTVSIAEGKMAEEDIAAWLKEHAIAIS
jgi:death on curing protein